MPALGPEGGRAPPEGPAGPPTGGLEAELAPPNLEARMASNGDATGCLVSSSGCWEGAVCSQQALGSHHSLAAAQRWQQATVKVIEPCGFRASQPSSSGLFQASIATCI